MENIQRLGVKISRNATTKYATTMKAAWNVNFSGIMTQILEILKKIVAEIL
jgi:hypothetical protein